MMEDESMRLTSDDLYLFNEGSLVNLYDKLGAHVGRANGKDGTFFAVWAPDAERVSLIGSFNDWDEGAHQLTPRGHSGIWEGFVPGVGVRNAVQVSHPFPLQRVSRGQDRPSVIF